MNISYSLFTDTGDHDPNEDTIGMTKAEDNYVFVLADGLGGHGSGEVASQLAVKTSIELFEKEQLINTYIAEAFEQSQKEILKKQRDEHCVNGMKTTMVILMVTSDKIKWGHIGDSRLYYFRKNRLIKRTFDHSVPQMLVAAHKLKEKEIRNHPDRNRLLRVLGTDWEEPKYEIAETIKIENGKKQAFLLCTDGFWELIEEKDMIKALKKAKTAEEWLYTMSEIVKKNGEKRKKDNFSAIAVLID